MSGSAGHRERGGAAGAEIVSLDDPAARAAYGRLWAASPQRTVYARPEAVESVAAAFGLTPRLAAVPDGDAFAAAVPVFEKRRGPFVAASLPPLVPFVSPLLAGPLAAHEVHAHGSPLDRLLALLAGRYDQAALLLHPSLEDLRPLTWGGWTVTPRYTYEVGLTGDDDLLARWSGTARRTSRHDAGGYRFEEDARHTDAAIALTLAGYARHGERLRVDAGAMRRLAAAFAEAGLARVFATLGPGASEPEAVVVLAHDGRTAHYWIAGSRPGPAMTVLLAHLLPHLRAEGFAAFDLAGANTPSIAEFKRKFGGRLRTYGHARIVPSRLLRLLGRLRP